MWDIVLYYLKYVLLPDETRDDKCLFFNKLHLEFHILSHLIKSLSPLPMSSPKCRYRSVCLENLLLQSGELDCSMHDLSKSIASFSASAEAGICLF